jgi:putative sterol carrier protein
MKTVPAISTGPVDDVRRADPHTRVALADAVARSARLWRSVADSAAPVPGLTWTVGQTAAHVVGDMSEYTEALTRHVNGDRAALSIPDGSPARVRTAVNDRHLIDVAERDPRRLADMLEETAARYLAAASAIGTSEGVAILTADGLVLEPAVMTCLLLGEQLVHGLDIARGAHRPWSIGRDDALLVIPAVLSLAPKYLRHSRSSAELPASPPQAGGTPTSGRSGPHRRRTKDLSLSFELRMRGGCRYRMAITDGTGVVTAAGEKADCVITADPVAFLLIGLGRVPQFSQLLRGKLRAGGRKPWLAAKFGTLLASP